MSTKQELTRDFITNGYTEALERIDSAKRYIVRDMPANRLKGARVAFLSEIANGIIYGKHSEIA